MSSNNLDQVTRQLSKTNVKDSGVSFQGKSLKLDSKEDCKEIVKAINECKDLQYLNLEGNTLGVSASECIAKALESKGELKRALWKDMFTGRMKTEIPKCLQYLGSGLNLAGAQLTELDLSDNAFGPIGVEGLAGLLMSRTCYQLKELRLNNNGLGISGGIMLANALLECHKNSTSEGKSLALRLFTAGRNRLENKGAEALSKVFQTLGTLEEIAMPQNGIYHVGIKALSKAFMKNPNLRVLNLNDNTVTQKGAVAIADALPHLQKLQVLDLGDCLLKTSGATTLANALASKHAELEELHLGYNEIKTSGALAIARAVKNKAKLKTLNLNGNQFGEDGRESLKQEMEKNHKINTLEELGDDESNDEEDEDEEENGENEDNDESEDEDTRDESNLQDDVYNDETFVMADINQTGNTKTDQTNLLTNILQNLSVSNQFGKSADEIGPVSKFLNNPTLENFVGIDKEKIDQFLSNNQDSSTEFYIDTFVPVLIKISSLSSYKNEPIKSIISELTSDLYRKLFKWAIDNNQLSLVNNALFVNLGLIKSEDKNFKLNWNVGGCLTALRKVISDGIAPSSTQQILDCCLARSNRKVDEITIS